MPPMLAWLGVVLSLLVSVLPGLPTGSSARSALTDVSHVRDPGLGRPATLSCTPGWHEQDSSFARSVLASVVASGDSAWAVGMTTFASEDPRYPIAVEWDGSQWTEMPIKASSEERALFGVDRSTSGRMWAVGYRVRSGAYRPMVMRWLDGRWQVAFLGPTGERGGALLGVRARNDADTWAVGYRIGTWGQQPLAIRRTGTVWKEFDPAIPAGGTSSLLDVDIRGGNDAWAVGWLTLRSAPRPYVVHWNGSHWVQATSGLPKVEGALTSIALDGADGAWAVGYRLSSGRYKPLTAHWDGHRWKVVATPSVHSDIALLRSVRMDASRHAIAVGTRWDAGTGTWQGITFHRIDGAWSQIVSPRTSAGSEFRDVAPNPEGTSQVVGATGLKSFAGVVCPESLSGDGSPDQGPGAPAGSPAPATSPAASPSVAPSTVPSEAPAASPAASQGISASPHPGPTGDHRPRTSPHATGSAPAPVVARDVTVAAGLAKDTTTYGAVRADFDGDGWPDLFIGRHANPGWLVLNHHGTFAAAPGVSIPRRDRHGCTTGDANGDGLPDLYCANGSYHGAGFKANELYIQQPDGTFVDQAVAMHASDPFGRGRLVAMFDLDHDKYSDIFLADRPVRTDGLPSIDRVLANPGGTGYVQRSVSGLDASAGADCLRTADLDKDGWTDIVLCQRGQDRKDAFGVHILRNDHGRLVDVTATSGIRKRPAVDAVVADMNGDHRPDIVEITPWELRVHLRKGDHYVLGYTRTLNRAVAVAAGDIDGDGDQDLYIAQGTTSKQQPDLLLRNTGTGRSFTTIPLPDTQRGSAESVTPIDYDKNGLMDFLVLNGKGSQNPGPVQLIAFFPRK